MEDVNAFDDNAFVLSPLKLILFGKSSFFAPNIWPSDANWHHVAFTWKSQTASVDNISAFFCVFIDAEPFLCESDAAAVEEFPGNGYLVMGQDQVIIIVTSGLVYLRLIGHSNPETWYSERDCSMFCIFSSQDAFLGGFDESQRFMGQIDDLRIWTTALTGINHITTAVITSCEHAHIAI